MGKIEHDAFLIGPDAGALKDEIVEGKTGFVFRPEDPVDLANAIERYFASDLFADLNSRRQKIRDYTKKRHSWDVVGQGTMDIYAILLRLPSPRELSNREASKASLEMKAPSCAV